MFRKLFLLYLHDIQNAVLCKPGCRGLAIPVQDRKNFWGQQNDFKSHNIGVLFYSEFFWTKVKRFSGKALAIFKRANFERYGLQKYEQTTKAFCGSRILEKIYSNKSKLQTRTDFAVLRVRELFEIPFYLHHPSLKLRMAGREECHA